MFALLLLFLFVSSLSANNFPKNCKELKDNGDTTSGIKMVYLNTFLSDVPFEVFCDQDTDGGGWTVIQRRTPDGVERENFNRNWTDYQVGFGDKGGEFWLGLENMHHLTKHGPTELRIDLENWDGEVRYANYKNFKIFSDETDYKLKIARYSGDAGDSFLFGEANDNINGMKFSTFDKDHDNWGENCALNSKSGWWYNFCTRVNLNGIPYKFTPTYEWHGIMYYTYTGSRYSLRSARMMVRPIQGNFLNFGG